MANLFSSICALTFCSPAVGARGLLRRSKGPVATHPRAVRITGYDSEMVGSVHSQSADVRSNVPVRVPSLSHHSRGVPVTSRRTVLEMNGRGQ